MNEETKERIADGIVTLTKGAVGSGAVALAAINPTLGFLTPVVTEFIFSYLPNRQVQKIQKTLDQTKSDFGDKFDEALEERLQNPEFQDFFGRILQQSLDANTKVKTEAVSRFLLTGMNSNSKLSVVNMMLSVFNRLEELDLVILIYIDQKYRRLSIQGGNVTPESSFEEISNLTMNWRFGTKNADYDNKSDPLAEHSITKLAQEQLIQIYENKRPKTNYTYSIADFGAIFLLMLGDFENINLITE